MVKKKKGSIKKELKKQVQKTSKKGSKKGSKKQKRQLPQKMKDVQILRKMIASENPSLSNGKYMVMLNSKIFKEAGTLNEAIELYKKYKKEGKIEKMYKEFQK